MNDKQLEKWIKDARFGTKQVGLPKRKLITSGHCPKCYARLAIWTLQYQIGPPKAVPWECATCGLKETDVIKADKKFNAEHQKLIKAVSRASFKLTQFENRRDAAIKKQIAKWNEMASQYQGDEIQCSQE